jgi:cytochrome b561
MASTSTAAHADRRAGDPSERPYTATAKVFHWLTAVLMAGSFGLAFVMVDLENSPLKVDLYNWHKTVGLTILGLATLRLAWRATHPAPPPPPTMATWERVASGISHVTLYAFLFAQPIVGLVMSWASGFPTILFDSFTVPNPIGTDQALYDTLSEVHEISGFVLLGLIAVHAAAAIRHHVVKKDAVLRRMLPGGRRT